MSTKIRAASCGGCRPTAQQWGQRQENTCTFKMSVTRSYHKRGKGRRKDKEHRKIVVYLPTYWLAKPMFDQEGAESRPSKSGQLLLLYMDHAKSSKVTSTGHL